MAIQQQLFCFLAKYSSGPRIFVQHPRPLSDRQPDASSPLTRGQVDKSVSAETGWLMLTKFQHVRAKLFVRAHDLTFSMGAECYGRIDYASLGLLVVGTFADFVSGERFPELENRATNFAFFAPRPPNGFGSPANAEYFHKT
jgi:hypothetical protein